MKLLLHMVKNYILIYIYSSDSNSFREVSLLGQVFIIKAI